MSVRLASLVLPHHSEGSTPWQTSRLVNTLKGSAPWHLFVGRQEVVGQLDDAVGVSAVVVVGNAASARGNELRPPGRSHNAQSGPARKG